MQKPEGSHLFSANIIICELQKWSQLLLICYVCTEI